MSISYNMNSILDKAKAAMKSDSVKARIKKIKDDAMLSGKGQPGGTGFPGMDKIADEFMDILQREINVLAGVKPSEGGLGATAISALLDLEKSTPYKDGENTYSIRVSFANELHRDSMYPKGYPDGVDDIAALLNDGYSADNRVYGVWHGIKHPSLRSRDGAGFIDNAVRIFNDGYGTKYKVIIKTDYLEE